MAQVNLLKISLFLAAIAFAGCEKQPFGVAPVSGKVTYEDGSLIPAERLFVNFEPKNTDPVDGKYYPRAAVAEVDVETGEFAEATTIRYGDGAIIGPHWVTISSTDKQGSVRTKHVPPKYGLVDDTPFEVEVTPGSEPFEFKIEKPKGRG